MKRLRAALWVELLKVRRAKIFLISVCFFIFMGIMMGMFMFLSMHPEIANRSSTIEMKTSFLGGSDWKAYYNLLIQMLLTVGVIGSGIIASWVFGREFSDHVIKDILALPVHRSTIVISKLIVLFAWSILLAILFITAGILTGIGIHIPGWEAGYLFSFLKCYMVCSILNALLITPVAFVASAGRGYILPVSFVILVMILTQTVMVGLPGLTAWFPWALPALYSGVAGNVLPLPGPASYMLYFILVLAGLVGTLAWWRFADHK